MDKRIADEKLECNVDRKGAQISELPSAKINKSEYFTGKMILTLDQTRLVKQAEFTYSQFGQES